MNTFELWLLPNYCELFNYPWLTYVKLIIGVRDQNLLTGTKCDVYTKYECFWVMSFGMIWTQPVRVKLLAFYGKCYLIDHLKWWRLCCTSPCWERPTCGGCQPTPMIDDLCYDMIPRIADIVGNVGCLAQCAGSLPIMYKLIRYELWTK